MHSETTTAREVFAPLWGIMELGAIASSGLSSLENVSLARFVAKHRETLDALLTRVRKIGGFQRGTMAIFEEAGWEERRTPQDTAVYLMLWSGGIEPYPADVADPAVVRRMVSAGADLQLTEFMHGLVSAAVVRGDARPRIVDLIIEAVGGAGCLLGRGDRRVPETFRMWRVARLPQLLRPDSPAPETTKASLRTYARALEGAVGAEA